MAAHRVVIVGGGFGGLHAAQRLRDPRVEVTLVDRRNFHLFQPLLYQVATGALSPANIAAPLRALFRRQKNVRVLLGEVTDLDPAARTVRLADGSDLAYDTLILAAGARNFYFGHDDWEAVAPALKTVEDATAIRRRILSAFEAAEREGDPGRRAAWLTFVVVGGGPTGVEMAGALGELAHHTLRGNFRTFDPAEARILLVEGLDRVLSTYPEKLSVRAAASLARLGVAVRARSMVTGVTAESVTLKGPAGEETVPARTVIWSAGIAAPPLARAVAARTGAATDRAGRLVVSPDLSLPGHPEILVIGDLASSSGEDGKPYPAMAPVAIQAGRYAADLVLRRVAGKRPPGPFRYRHRGSMATIGRSAAVVDLGWLRLAGFAAWLTWLFVHLMMLVQFESRVLVFVQWAWSYFTRNRSARLITGESGESTGPRYGI